MEHKTKTVIATHGPTIMEAYRRAQDDRHKTAIMHVYQTGEQYEYPSVKHGHRVTYRGKNYKNMSTLCKEYGVCPKKVWNRSDQYGISRLEALDSLLN